MNPAPAAAGARTGAPLHDLPGLLRDEPALAQVLGRASATLAVAGLRRVGSKYSISLKRSVRTSRGSAR